MRKILFVIIASAILTGCKIESSNCPRQIAVPFESVSIPDSVPARCEFPIKVRLYDYGCYQNAEIMDAIVDCDTIYLSARANYDECGCPSESKDLELTYYTFLDTVYGGSTKYFVYLQVSSNKDSIQYCRDSIVIY